MHLKDLPLSCLPSLHLISGIYGDNEKEGGYIESGNSEWSTHRGGNEYGNTCIVKSTKTSKRGRGEGGT